MLPGTLLRCRYTRSACGARLYKDAGDQNVTMLGYVHGPMILLRTLVTSTAFGHTLHEHQIVSSCRVGYVLDSEVEEVL